MTDADTIRQALDAALICSGSWGLSADPSLCRDCVARARAALVILDRLEARLAAAERRAERGVDAETDKIERGTEILRLQAMLEAIRAHDFYGMRDREFVTNLLDKLAAAAPEEPTP